MIKISDQNNDFGAVLICAVRYCIGRQTYMPGLVIDFIRPLLSKLDSKDADGYGTGHHRGGQSRR